MTAIKTGSALILAIGVLFATFALTTPTASAQTYYYNTPTTHSSSMSFGGEQAYILYLLQAVAQLQAQLEALLDDDDYQYGNSEIEITTRSARDVDEDSARLEGEIDFNSSDYAYVWFEWGEDEDDLDEETPRFRLDDNDDEDFAIRLTGLDEDERYYFRAVGEDEDERVDRGSIRDFETDDDGHSSGNDDEPDVDTEDAEDITDDSVELYGEVDMNDFRNGVVFFVYGEDEDQIEDVEDDYDSYHDVDEDGDDMRKERVDNDLDNRASYRLDIDGLDDDTEYFFTICVEYEDEDDDDVLACGNVESFETDD